MNHVSTASTAAPETAKVRIRQFVSKDKNLQATILLGPKFNMVFMSGRAETDSARELQLWLADDIMNKSADKNVLLVLDKVVFLSSSALGMINLLSQETKKQLIVMGVKPHVRKGLTAVNVIETPGKIFFFDNLERMRARIDIPPQLAKIIDQKYRELVEFESEKTREGDIYKSYHPEWSSEEISEELMMDAPYLNEAKTSNVLVLPARYEMVAAVYLFFKRLAEEYGFYDESGQAQDALTDHDCEALAKEIVENIVRWGYKDRKPGGFIVRATVQGNQVLIGFADWGIGHKPNFLAKMLRLGGQGQNRIRHMIQMLYKGEDTANVVRHHSPAPELSEKQKKSITKRHGPQAFEKGYVLVLALPVRRTPELEYDSGDYPANLI